VVMFGITNRCNLSCGFCSRDLEAGSEWTAESAFDMLAGLAGAGVLEVAFGGGEPLVFRGFDDLVRRLAEETALAVHFTTNGTLLTEDRLNCLRGAVGEIRLSIYDDNPWRDRVAMLASSGVQFGANLLVTPGRLRTLPALLDELAALGCRDVALLSYVGGAPALHLGPADDERLRAMITNSPVRVRFSVCFGDRLEPVPRLFAGVDGDCGAGVDFLSLTPDRKVKSCSFQDDGIPVTKAEDVMRIWRMNRPQLLGASARPGCARTGVQPVRQGIPDGIRIWRGFSGNNSGECVLVGRFETAEDAERYLSELLPAFRPGEDFPPTWRDLLTAEGIAIGEYSRAPDAMAVVGPTVMLATESALEDDFPALRTLVWKRGGRAVYNGIHEHGAVDLAVGLRFREAAALDAVEAKLAIDEVGVFHRRGLHLYGLVRQISVAHLPDFLERRVAALKAIAADHGVTLAAELVPVDREVNLARSLALPAPEDTPEWLWVRFRSAEEAKALSRGLDGWVTLADRYLLVGANRIARRVAAYLQNRGGTVHLIPGPVVRLRASFWRSGKGVVTIDLGVSLRARLPTDDRIEICGTDRAAAVIETTRPGTALTELVAIARDHGVDVWIEAEPVPSRLVHALGRLADDLK
jgi:MoaA/NifB/PqqE/SkfB family radical SAM enzyme